MPEIQPIISLFSDFATINQYDSEEFEELKLRVQRKFLDADCVGQLLTTFSYIQRLETRRRETMMWIRNQILNVVDVLLHSHSEYFKSASKTYLSGLHQLWHSIQESTAQAQQHEQRAHVMDGNSERMRRVTASLSSFATE